MKPPNHLSVKGDPRGTEFEVELVSPVHRCPPEGSGIMPCCDRTPFEVPRTDRMAVDPALVTCCTP